MRLPILLHRLPSLPFERIFISLILFAWFTPLALQRLIAPDEGFYLFAARDVLRGEHLYRDFFFPQMPLVPYLYAAWFWITDVSWAHGRLLMSFLTSCVGFLLFDIVLREVHRRAAYLAVIAFALTPWVWGWFLITKPYSIATLAALLMYLSSRSGGRGGAFLSGAFLAIAGGSRLYFFALTPLYFLASRSSLRESLVHLRWFLAGLFFLLLPMAVTALGNLEQFWFNNVGYHLVRTPESGAPSRLSILAIATRMSPSSAIADYHLFALLILLVAHLLLAATRKTMPHLSWWYSSVLVAVSLIPSPAYYQYFCTAVPFLIIVGAVTLRDLGSLLPLHTVRPIGSIAIVLSLVWLLLQPLRHDLDRYLRTGYGVLTPGKTPVPQFSIRHARKVGESMSAALPAGSVVLATWPGHLLETNLRAFPCSENQFGYRAAERLQIDFDSSLRICSRAYIEGKVLAGEPDGIVFAPWSDGYFPPPYPDLIREGYSRVFHHGSVTAFAKGSTLRPESGTKRSSEKILPGTARPDDSDPES